MVLRSLSTLRPGNRIREVLIYNSYEEALRYIEQGVAALSLPHLQKIELKREKIGGTHDEWIAARA
jgi:hypothetical protein